MDRVKVVTSFSPKGYEDYGKNFIETFQKLNNIPLIVYYEDEQGCPPGPEWRRLRSCSQFEYMTDFGNLPAAHGIVGKRNDKYVADYRLTCTRFAKKVFALTDYDKDCDWWVWVDADVEHNKRLDEEFWKKVCPGKALISYLGRKDWDHSECGFVAYRVSHPVPRAFLKEFRRMYVSGEVFSLPQWHDSFVFDWARKAKFYAWQKYFHNISEGVSGNHVWPKTVLGEYMDHAKGLRKRGVKYDEDGEN